MRFPVTLGALALAAGLLASPVLADWHSRDGDRYSRDSGRGRSYRSHSYRGSHDYGYGYSSRPSYGYGYSSRDYGYSGRYRSYPRYRPFYRSYAVPYAYPYYSSPYDYGCDYGYDYGYVPYRYYRPRYYARPGVSFFLSF